MRPGGLCLASRSFLTLPCKSAQYIGLHWCGSPILLEKEYGITEKWGCNTVLRVICLNHIDRYSSALEQQNIEGKLKALFFQPLLCCYFPHHGTGGQPASCSPFCPLTQKGRKGTFLWCFSLSVLGGGISSAHRRRVEMNLRQKSGIGLESMTWCDLGWGKAGVYTPENFVICYKDW